MRRWMPGLVVLALLAAVPLGSRAIARQVTPPLPGFAPGGEERMLADLEATAKAGIFAGRGTTRDAAPVINRLVAADAPLAGQTPAWWAEKDGLAAFEALPKAEWLDHPEVTGTYDLSFLAEWRQYDHWTWDGADPFAAHFAANPGQCSYEAPIPNYVPFQRLAKIRLAQGLASGDLTTAVAEVEHLAMLVASTDTLVGVMVGRAILDFEDRAITRAAEAGQVVPTRTWTKTDLDRAKPAMMAVAAVMITDPSSPTARTLTERADELPGVCAGIAEAVNNAALLRGMAGHPWPGEIDYSAQYAGIEAALAHSGCAIPFARQTWAQAEGASTCMPDTESWDASLIRIPYVRTPIIGILHGIAVPNFVGPYAEP